MNEPNFVQVFGALVGFTQNVAFAVALILIVLGTARIISLFVERPHLRPVESIYLDKRIESAAGYLTFGCLNRILTAVWLGVVQLLMMNYNLRVSTALLLDLGGMVLVILVPIGTAALVRSSLSRRRFRLKSELNSEICYSEEQPAGRQSMGDERERPTPVDGDVEQCPNRAAGLERNRIGSRSGFRDSTKEE